MAREFLSDHPVDLVEETKENHLSRNQGRSPAQSQLSFTRGM